ncbi:transposase [Azospirillum brasilense]|nr:transposase [Azospirillum brasilense]
MREQEAGRPTAETCRKLGISEATFFPWKAKSGGLEVSEAKDLKTLEDENARLKRLLAEVMLDTRCSRTWPQEMVTLAAGVRHSWRGPLVSPLLLLASR